MDKILQIIATLVGGGKFAGLTLAQIVALAEVINANEPLFEELIHKGLPLAKKLAAVIETSYGLPAPHLAGFDEPIPDALHHDSLHHDSLRHDSLRHV